MIGAASFARSTKRGKLQNFSTSLYEINRSLDYKTVEGGKLGQLIPEEYHGFLPLFSEIAARELPPHRPYDHTIPLKEGFNPSFGPIYSLSRVDLEALKAWLEENLFTGFIRSSSSHAGALVLFAKKPGGGLRLRVDYRGLNEGTIKNRYPPSLLRETLLLLQNAKYYTKPDVHGAYNLIHKAEDEEWKTAFRTRYGPFESLVMPSGLTNVPASFQHFINDVLRPFLNIFATAYLDGVLIYSEMLKEHKRLVRQVLQALSDAGLHLAPEKCEFHKQSVKYLGFLTTEGVAADPAKVATVQEWGIEKSPIRCRTEVRRFLGFAGFCRRFINSYSRIVLPLTRHTGEDIPFDWTTECDAALGSLKTASDFVSAGVLFQYNGDGILHPVAFYSKKHSPAE